MLSPNSEIAAEAAKVNKLQYNRLANELYCKNGWSTTIFGSNRRSYSVNELYNWKNQALEMVGIVLKISSDKNLEAALGTWGQMQKKDVVEDC